MSMGEMNPSNLFLCCHRLNYAGRMCSFERFFSLGVLNHLVECSSS